MSRFELRPAAAGDRDEIIDIWRRSFGDAPELIAALLEAAALLTCALCAAVDGRVRSVMFAFEGLELNGERAAYLYALCTHPDARGQGMGAAVVRALTERCFDRGAQTVLLSPADASLDAWYARILGTQPLYALADLPVAHTDCGAACVSLGAAAYADARGECAAGVTTQLLTAQSVLHRFCGGGFFRIAAEGVTALACAEPQGETLLLRELFCPEVQRPAVCGALAKHFGCRRVLLRQAAETGQRIVYIKHDRSRSHPRKTAMFPYTLE